VNPKERHLASTDKGVTLEAPVLRVNSENHPTQGDRPQYHPHHLGIGVGIVLYIGNIITVNHRS
jgi:hypothetical protein